MGLLLVTFLFYKAAAGPVVRGEATPQMPSLMPSCVFCFNSTWGEGWKLSCLPLEGRLVKFTMSAATETLWGLFRFTSPPPPTPHPDPIRQEKRDQGHQK